MAGQTVHFTHVLEVSLSLDGLFLWGEGSVRWCLFGGCRLISSTSLHILYHLDVLPQLGLSLLLDSIHLVRLVEVSNLVGVGLLRGSAQVEGAVLPGVG